MGVRQLFMADLREQEYFSDGLSEELLNLLAQIPELRVTSRSSAFSYKGKDFKISEVGRELNVERDQITLPARPQQKSPWLLSL
jgi:hypothetical protein